MTEVLLVHGWGFDASLWDDVRALLPDVPTHAADLGYFGRPVGPETTTPLLCVGHSFGVQWLLRHWPEQASGLLTINSFTRFTGPDGTPARVVDRMLARLEKSPDQVVIDFRQRCGDDTPLPGKACIDPLRRDLQSLRDDDPLLPAVPIRSLQGADDPILPEALRRAGPGHHPVTLPWHGHLLPLTAPEICARTIRKMLA